LPLLALLVPLPWATFEPQPVQRSLISAHDPSANRKIVDGRTTSGWTGWPGALMVEATLSKKYVGAGLAACAAPATINARTKAVAATARFIEILSARHGLALQPYSRAITSAATRSPERTAPSM
jgi:hypothetical protein